MSVTDRPLTKGYIARIYRGNIIAIHNFQYNPTTVSRVMSVQYNYDSPPGSASPNAFFKSIDGNKITLELLLDAVESYSTDKEGVGAQKAFFESFMQPDIDSYSEDLGQFIPPPQARYGSGNESFDVTVDNVRFNDVRWNRQHICTRSRVQLQMTTYWTDRYKLLAWLHHLETLRSLVSVYPGERERTLDGI